MPRGTGLITIGRIVLRSIVIIATFAGILAGCGTVDSISERFPNNSEPTVQRTSSTVPNAVTRNTAQERVQVAGVQTERRLPTASAPVAPQSSQGIDPTLDPNTARSYSAMWEEGGYRYRTVMFPHVIDGCKVMIQSRRSLDYVSGSQGEFEEREGSDCNCDLMIDGMEFFFGQLNDEYKTPRMLSVCEAPGVDGATRQLEIMREGLKEDRNFDKMKNVEGF